MIPTRRFPNASTACQSWPSTSGGPGTPRRAKSSAGSTTRCGAQTAHNPVRMLRQYPAETARRAAADRRQFLGGLRRGDRGARRARAARTTPGGDTVTRGVAGQPIAYFSAEFALHQSLPIYAGGLGVLAGDHCKEASDLGVPLIGVGFMYPQGYFHQRISADGWQQESLRAAQLGRRADRAGDHARRQAVRHRRAARRPQRARVGVARAARPREAVPARHRSRGERARGIASCRRACTAATARRASSRRSSSASAACARCKALGSAPAVWHLNEGHAAFVVLQRIRDLIEHGAIVRRRRSRKCGARRSSPRTRRCRPATTRFRSTWSRRISPAAGARSARTANAFLALGALRQRRAARSST